MADGTSPAVRSAILAARPASVAFAKAWREHSVRAAIDASFADCTSAAQVADVAEQWFTDDAWVAELLAPLVAEVRAWPLLDVPLKVSRDGSRTGAVLFENAVVSISASVIDACALAAAAQRASVVASGRMTVTRYIRAHGAKLRRWTVEGDGMRVVEQPSCLLADGAILRCDGRVTAQAIEAPRHDVVQLVAHVRIDAAATMREYTVADGCLLRQATLDDGAARTAMLLTLLRHCGRRDAAAQFDAATRDTASPFRWDAMREWIALDAASALPRLEEMALGDSDAQVHAAASATLALVTRKMREAACHA
ncbi:hypothetical protein [Sphingomonas japonica]|uniref:Uncharacterized protein n=1 Tax=Sphingomonas japonica TaxID=511662 RepID=A0ABX0TYG6_9SPHN|nr:hypothetical protein [Sphingomonas japonica]NIJ23355.1 hypothetical protein [Sphingomonas japonica]